MPVLLVVHIQSSLMVLRSMQHTKVSFLVRHLPAHTATRYLMGRIITCTIWKVQVTSMKTLQIATVMPQIQAMVLFTEHLAAAPKVIVPGYQLFIYRVALF